MRIGMIVFLLVVLTSIAYADDGIVLFVREGGFALEHKVLGQVKGSQFEAIRKDVEEAVRLLGKDRIWEDFGPEASYMSAEITIGEIKYILSSWYPLERSNEKTAVSETRGFVGVSGKEEKEKIEAQNSNKYKALVRVFDLAMKQILGLEGQTH